MDQPDPILGQPTPPTPAPSFFVALPSWVQSVKQWHQNHPQKKNITSVSVLIGLLLVFLLGRSILGSISFSVPQTNYVPVYTLVNDKISQHGAIIVNLPKGVAMAGAELKVAFEPALEGKWVASTLPNAIVFKPSAELALGKHYLVSLDTGDGTIKKDFLVDQDPAVVSVFPSGDAEADLSSAITIVFNRPMVPLTTLSELDTINIPVTISPETPGKFKWISTRTLQFIPSNGLFGSAHYSVTIRPDFVSMDGLSVAGKTYTFTTKQLRLNSSSSGTIVYNQPINFYFNQPVDLDKTSAQIKLSSNISADIAFTASYGTSPVWDAMSRTQKSVEDKSIISILPKNSLNGHSNVWDFATSYTAQIIKVYPVGGDIALTSSSPGLPVYNAPAVQSAITTSPVLEGVTEQSDKTDLASAQLFDPAGTMTFSFYEDVDMGRSSIQAKGLKNISYGKKCQNSDDYGDTCIKVDDKSQLLMTFDPTAYAEGEQVPVTFGSLVNTAGYQVNASPVVVTLSVYPKLQITKTVPASGDIFASISDLVLCTNVPLKAQDAKSFYKNFKASKYIVFGRWDNPYLESADSYDNPPPCAVGDYVNRIHYGLLPQQPYTLSATVQDDFGQSVAAQLAFKTQEAPKFYLRFQNLQKIYNVTTPDKTQLTFATENFDYVNVNICKISPDKMVQYLATQPSDVSITPNSSLPCLTTVSKVIPLKSDQWVAQYFQINLKDYFTDTRGQYVISFSHPQYQNSDGNVQYAKVYLSVTNLAVTDNRVKWTSNDYLPDVPNLTNSDTRGSVYWVSQVHSLVPVGGAKVSVYQTTDVHKPNAPVVYVRSNTTNAGGVAEFPLVADVVGATVTSGDDTAIVSQWADTLSSGGWSNASQDERLYMYTDRPIYRPGQQVFLKGLYRVNFDGTFQIFRDNDIKIEIRDSKENTILTQKVPVSEYGTFSANVTLPSDAPLGSYTITARNNQAYFDVQDYVGAAFETQVQSNKDEYIAGDTANINVSAKYYFGVPLDGGDLNYTITSQNYYFDRYTDGYFNFGGGWYDCYDCGYGDTYLKSGKATLDNQGAAQLQMPLDFGTLFKGSDGDQSKIFVVHGTIKDKQGKSVSFQQSFIVHRADFYLGVNTDPSFAAAKQPFMLRLKTVDVQGKAVSKGAIALTVNKVSWQSDKRQEVDGGFYNQPHRTLTPVSTKNLSTNYSGDYSESLNLTDPGEYELDVVAKDNHGNTVKSSSEVYIYGQGTIDVEPTNNATLNMTAENTNVKVGDTAKFIIQNPYPHAKALISIERGRIFTYEIVDINQSIYEYQFPVTDEYTPNVYASAILLSSGPDIKFGQVAYTVDRKEKALTIKIKSDKTSYLPGEKVALNVTTTDSRGLPVPADVSVAVADLSVLALAGNPKKNPLVFFYDGFPLTVTSEANIKNLLEESPIPTGTKGGDGGNPADLATKKRGEFKDTAFWQADVVTDAQGSAQISFTLPDNLTKWQIESVGITKDTKLGVSYQEITAQKDVMTLPLVPRFIVPGDEFMIGEKVFNQTSTAQTLAVSIESSSLTIEGVSSLQRTIQAGDTDTVYFKVKAPESKMEGVHTFTLSAKNKNYNDTVEQTLPITPNTTYEYTATAGSTNTSSAEEYLYLPDTVLPDRGGLTIKTSATLAVYLSDALKYLFAYPYGCSEQLASKLSAIAITKQALAVPNVGSQFKLPTVVFNGNNYTVDQAVDIGLTQLYDNQTPDGGFAYYKGLKSDPYLTIHVLNTLVDIKDAGYPVRQNVIDQTSLYLYGQVSYYKTHPETSDTLILMAYVLSRIDSNSPAYTTLLGAVESLATSAYLSDTASSDTLGYLALLTANGGVDKAFKDKVFAALINRVDIDSRGAYVKTNQSNIGYVYYETPEKDTALFLKALVADKREYAQTDNIVRWLVASRASDGSWGSTNTSVTAIDALSNYLVWKRETESNFTLDTKLDGNSITSTTFNAQNILSTIETFLPISQIETNKTHALTFAKTNLNSLPNNFYYDLSLKYFLPVQQIAPRDEGVSITRDFYSVATTKNTQPLTTAKVGDVVRGVLTIISPKERHLFAVEDYIPAGFELVNFDLATEDQTTATNGSVGITTDSSPSGLAVAHLQASPGLSLLNLFSGTRDLAAALGLFGNTTSDNTVDTPVTYQQFYPDFKELRDNELFMFAQDVSPGTYTYTYYLRATTPGTFSHLPAIASDMYFPENFGRTAGSVFTVVQ